MENSYVKQFPELMKGKKIMYNHGFGSSAASGTVKRIAETFPNARVVAFDLPLHPEEAIELLRRKVKEEQPDLIIGSSMGGMYTEMLYGFDRICVNPAFEMGQTMKEHQLTGKQVWMNPREDGEKEFIVTKALEKEYRDFTEQCFSGLEAISAADKAREQQRVRGLFGDKDDVVNTFELFRAHYPQAIRFHGGHRLDDHAFISGVVPVIRQIDDEQEGRERPIVYVDASTMQDAYGKPKSSFKKAINMLIERYRVYFVGPAPTNDQEKVQKLAVWTEEHISTPAYDSVIYTNQKQLLYGDYFIDAHPCPNFMGTTLAFGSDEFKTWEDIIVYFGRLGGQ